MGRVSSSHIGHAAGTGETTTHDLWKKRIRWDRISYRVGRAVVPEPDLRGWNRWARTAWVGLLCLIHSFLGPPHRFHQGFFFLFCSLSHKQWGERLAINCQFQRSHDSGSPTTLLRNRRPYSNMQPLSARRLHSFRQFHYPLDRTTSPTTSRC